jgi:DNA-binding transcriptional ArsR family regulator
VWHVTRRPARDTDIHSEHTLANTPPPLGEDPRQYMYRCIQRWLYGRAMTTMTRGGVLARFGHALSDPTRSRILLALGDAPAYPAELAELLGVSRQGLSNHLACLRGCGLVVALPEGRRMRYELADPRLAHALADLLGVVLAVDPQFCDADDAEGCC